jgi:hypothetical protein
VVAGLVIVLAGVAPGVGATPAASGAGPTLDTDIPVTATDLRRLSANNSPLVVEDPTDRRFVVAAHRVDAPAFGCGLSVSGDGGRGWITAEPVPELPEGAERCYAPEVAFDRRGALHYLFVGLHGEGNEPMGVFLTTSADHGRTFSPPWQVLGPENYQVRMVIDRSAGPSGGPGRLHLVWLQASGDAGIGALPSGDNPIVAAHSDDGGRTFSEPVRVSGPSRSRSVAPAVTLGPDGRLHVAYYDLVDDARDYQGLEGPTWEGTWALVHTSSGDGGRTFEPGHLVDDRIGPPGRVMLIFTMPPPALAAGPDGTLFVAWPDARSGDPDVLFRRSPDGGRSWEPPLRVNDDPEGIAAEQSLPRLAVAPGGRVDLVFLDRRHDARNLANDAYYAWSEDGGHTFSANLRLSGRSFSSRIGPRYQGPAAAGLVEFGSRLGLLARDDAALAVWTDTRNASGGTAQQDLFGAVIRFAAIPTGGDNRGPSAVTIGVVIVAAVGLVAAAGLVVLRRREQAGARG